MKVIYPCDYFKQHLVDEMYRQEADAFRTTGFEVVTLREDNQLPKTIESNDVLLYRGWMMSSEEYQGYLDALTSVGAVPFTHGKKYLNAHHLPNWYDQLKEYTAETVVINDLDSAEKTLIDLNWDKFFIKDYVKSLKTSMGSVIDDASKISELMQEMEKFRGKIEGGLCIRRYEDYKTETETRYFVINRKAYSPNESIPDIVNKVAELIDSQFFSVDIIENTDGELRVVEIGDGQVSDLTGWDAERFVECWK